MGAVPSVHRSIQRGGALWRPAQSASVASARRRSPVALGVDVPGGFARIVCEIWASAY